MPAKRIKIAFMGFGGRGSGFIDTFRRLNLWNDTVSCAGVHDISEESARRSMKRLGEEYPFYSDADELFLKEKPDACIIGSFENAHFTNYSVAAKYDIPVMVEKPLTTSLEEARAFLELSDKSKGPVLMAHNMRFAPILGRAKEMVDEGLVGTVHSLRFHNNVHYGSSYYRRWMRLRKNIGSLFCEKATHDLDIANFLTGSYPVSVYAVSKRYEYGGDAPNDLRCRDCPKQLDCPESMLNKSLSVGQMPEELEKAEDLCVWAAEADINDDDICILEYDNGMQGSYVQTFYTPCSYKSRIYTLVGSRGILEIDLDEFEGDLVFYPRYGSKKESLREHVDYRMRQHYDADLWMTKHFFKIIIGKEEPSSTVRDGYIAVVTGLAATQSADEKRVVDLRSLYRF